MSSEGTVEGGVFRFRAAHFEWLLQIAERLSLGFNDVGKRRHGTPATLFFCDELVRLYGSPDISPPRPRATPSRTGPPPVSGTSSSPDSERYNARSGQDLPLAFFTWHSRLEAQHAKHTQEELEELYFERTLDEDAFIRFGNEMLDGVAAFWEGLNEDRLALAR